MGSEAISLILTQRNPDLIPEIQVKTKNPKLSLHQAFGFSISRHSVLAYLRVNREEFLKNISNFRLEIQNDKNFIKQFVFASSFCAG